LKNARTMKEPILESRDAFRARRYQLLLCLAATSFGSLAPGPVAAAGTEKAHVRASLVAEVDAVSPGRPFLVGVRLEMDEGWHTYWENPGDSGLATKIAWQLPEGLSAGPVQWPAPSRMGSPPVVSYGFEGVVVLLSELEPAASLRPGRNLKVSGTVRWVECNEVCLPGRAELSLTLPVRAGAAPPGQAAAAVDEARKRLPRKAKGWKLVGSTGPHGLRLTFRPPRGGTLRSAHFYASEPQVLDHAKPQPLSRAADALVLDLAADPNRSRPLDRLRGVLVTEGADGRAAVEVDVPVGRNPLAQLGP
jgi:DsbC/DsbD-like thiol-disulfide interchange protein